MAKAQAQAKDSGNNKIIMVLLVLVGLMVAITAANTYLLMDTRTMAANALHGNATEEQRRDPVFVKVDPFTVNLRSDQFGPRLLYTGMTLEVQEGDTKNILLNNMPQVRSRLLVLLSGQDAEMISTPDGKMALSDSIKARLSEPYGGSERELEIFDVLFTEFIVQ
ncbi:flagellar basal body-associated protein FliL [Aliidiomarina halalkaliphila]|uniref:Flagellar protein FliL n=1 Tax=Aliidiomarina halalkaliphila TaxID=2593535 RepID=A0A552X1Q6_9GAMM|nr:flagellar basal body-associated protein FliL [Aliidiomarina halalkaliphila]TRW48819.1 flagellar basal body-associated protein FliL [Aliidiomarina halalkaliphila]